MKGFPFLNLYIAGPGSLSDFDGLSKAEKLEIKRKVSATNKLREQFRKEVPRLARKLTRRLNKNSESD